LFYFRHFPFKIYTRLKTEWWFEYRLWVRSFPSQAVKILQKLQPQAAGESVPWQSQQVTDVFYAEAHE
jgi:hypothetical protein